MHLFEKEKTSIFPNFSKFVDSQHFFTIFKNSGPRFSIFRDLINFCEFFKLHTHHYSDTPLPRFFFRAQCARGESARARSDQQKDEFLGAKRTPPEGWFHEPRSEAESALRKKKKSRTRRVHSHAHAHAHTCACRRACTHAHTKCACRRVRTHACVRMHPAGA